MADLLLGLNAQQREAVSHSGSPLLIVAGPGSGKTRVLTTRIAYHILERSIDPKRFIAVTFTNRAAQEMRVRLQELLGDAGGVHIGTFHWMCNALLRRYIDRLNYSRNFRLLSPAESRTILRLLIQSFPRLSGVSGAAQHAVDAVKNGLPVDAAAAAANLNLSDLRALIDLYGKRLRAIGAIDISDLQELTARLLTQHELVRDRCAGMFSELLVDEYQDTNLVQQEILSLLISPRNALTVVGDEDQAIYGWRQAAAGNAARFRLQFPHARVIVLSETYRSTKFILRAASSLIDHNPDREPKSLRSARPAGVLPVCFAAADEIDEAEWIAGQIQRLIDHESCAHSGVGVLFRTNVQSRAIEDALIRHAIPYRVYAGQRFYERPEVRSVLAYLRLAVDPSDGEAAGWLISRLAGVGPRRLALLRDRAGSLNESILFVIARPPDTLSPSVRASLLLLSSRIEAVRRHRAGTLMAAIDESIEVGAGQTETDDADSTREILEELRAMAHQFSAQRGTLRQFVDRMTLDASTGSGEGVSLLSLHSAKGLEFQAVFVAGLEEGLLPHRRALDSACGLEEERRLCYVGMTRAREYLAVSYAQGRMLGGHASIGGPSRFLGEIGMSNVELRTSRHLLSRPRLTTVSLGETLMHRRWGIGTVAGIEGRGHQTLVTINFVSVGSQRLQLCHAPLERALEDVNCVRTG
ncbi:MAG: ATP-dependent helicase [Chloroflexota bacterium]